LGLLAAVGALLLRWLAARDPNLSWVRPRQALFLALAFGAGIVVVGGEAFRAAGAVSPAGLADFLTAGLPGAARLARLGFEGLALLLAAWGSGLAVLPLAGTIVALAAAGHAAAVRPAWLGIGADVLHVVGAGLWAGTILAMFPLRPAGGWRGPQARVLIERFSPLAMIAFAGTAAFGVLRGSQELSSLADLVTSSYGQVLTAKSLAVLAMLPLSLLAWRKRAPSLRVEAALALAVVMATALLAAFPLPPGRAGEAEAAAAQRAGGLPRPGDLTLGSDAGDFLVGLTLHPGKPGKNELLVYLESPRGAAAAAGVPAQVSVQGRSVEMRPCGAACRRGEVDLHGGEDIEVRVVAADGGIASYKLPPLPAAKGAQLLRKASARMHQLRTLRIQESLAPPRPPERSTYQFEAPDRMRLDVSTGFDLIWVGSTRYERDKPSGPWQSEQASRPFRVPFYIWDDAPPMDPVILGQAVVGGVTTRVIAFFESSGNLPLWFRLWVGPDGLVHRAEMRAPGHFMDHRYSDFDAPLVIGRPPG
ncbi:MAG: copper resistance D family protein, partial [Chloroflexota bacterium]